MSGGTPVGARRRWLAWCALALPVLGILWLVAVVACLPAAPTIEQTHVVDEPTPGLLDTELAFWIHRIGGARERFAAGLSGDDGLDAASLKVWEGLARGDSTDGLFAPLVEWEREHDARVWVWTIEPVGTPPLVAYGVGQSSSVRARTAEALAADSLVTSAPPTFEPPGGLEEAWTRAITQDGMDLAFDPGMFQYWWGRGWQDVSIFSIVAGDTAWAGLMTPGVGDMTTPDSYFCPDGLRGIDPRSHDYVGLLDAVALRERSDIWILGPLTTDLWGYRQPEGVDPSDSAMLGEAVWPEVFVGGAGDAEPVPIALTPEQASLAGGRVAAMDVVTYLDSQAWVTSTIASGEQPPSALAFLVVYDEMPGRIGGQLPDAWRGFVGAHPVATLAAGILALVVSVPLAIVGLCAKR